MQFFKDKKLFLQGCLIAFFVAFLDLFSKRVIFAIITKGQTDTDYIGNFIEITSFFNLVHVWNRGVSFGLFSSFEYSHILFSCIVALILLIMLLWMYKNPKPYLNYALAFIIGGAIGNLFDRIKYGAVADFLDFHLASYHWPAFNIADSFVFIGVVMLLLEDFFTKKQSS